MAVPPRIVRWVDDNYRRPRVDPEWLNECYAWLTTEGGQDPDRNFQGLVDAIEHQILESNFQDSMLPGTGLPTHVALPSTTLTVKGVLVEVASRMEIANSAFSLNQTLMAREERLKAGDVEDEGGEGDIDVAGEGPIPKYPRGMLKFDLTDGTTMLPAMEYRPLPELSLEDTPLGYKMLLRDVRVNRGIAFLEPKSVMLLGHKTDDRDKSRQADFARGLRARIGLPEPPSDTENVVPAPIPSNPPPQAPRYPSPVTVRSPLREISPPPSPPAMYQGHHDEDLGARRRRIPNHNPDPLSASARPVPSPSRTATTSSYFTNPIASGSRSQTVVSSAPPNPTSILSLSPTLRNTMRPLYTASPPPSPGPEDEHFWSDNEAEYQEHASLSGDQRFVPDSGDSGVKFLAEMKARNTVQAQNGGSELQNGAITNGKKAGGGGGDTTISSDEFEDDIMFDTDVLAGLDAIDALNTNMTVVPPPVSTIGSSSLSGLSAAGTTSQPSGRDVNNTITDVITIEDDSDADDKENHPVPTRHVRRRMGDGVLTQGSGNGSQRARNSGRPVILARTPSAVIDLSDSDE